MDSPTEHLPTETETNVEPRRIALGVQYDGSSWNGWQTQPDGKTVQDVLQQALEKFSQQRLQVVCAGRTDAGVHALEQVVHFDAAIERDMFSWVRGVNTHLPPSIVLRWAREVMRGPSMADDDAFHARFSARSRTYHYVLYNHKVRSPLLRNRAGWVFGPLDVERMQEAAQCLLGMHDFSAFRSVHCQAKTPVKEMQQVSIVRRGDVILFTLRASAFLHHMVRNIVGSLNFVGAGKRDAAWMQELLESGDRQRAAPTFSPDGLYLAKVDYDAKWQLPQEDTTWPW